MSKTLTVLLTLACFAAPAWAGSDDGSSSHYVADAKKYLSKGELRAAEIQLKNALRENPNNIEARVTLGLVSLREGDGGGAERSFQLALQQSGDRQQLLPLLGRAYLMQGKAPQLLDELNRDGFPPEIEAQIAELRARAYLVEKDPDHAGQEAAIALTLHPEMPAALLILATLQRQQDNQAAAEALVDRALVAAPDNLPALEAKGELRESLGDSQGALDFYGKATALQPDEDKARLGEAGAFLALGQENLARNDVDTVLLHKPGNPVALYLRALILERNGHYAEALAALEPAADMLVDAVAPQVLLGELTLRANHLDKASAYAEHALSLAPQSISAALLMALIYDKKDQPQKIVPLLGPFAASAPDNGRVQMLLGDAYARLGHFDLAVKALTIAAKQSPADSALRIRLDASRIKGGEIDAGMADLSALLRAEPQTRAASMLLISTNMALGRLTDALALATKELSVRPTDNALDEAAGHIHMMMGDWAAADRDFQSALRKQISSEDAARSLILVRRLEGLPDQAEVHYAASYASNAADIQAMTALAELAQQKGDEDAAIGWLEKASLVDPNSLPLRGQMVTLLLAQKKTQKALALAQTLDQSAHDVASVEALLAQSQFAAGQTDNAILTLRHRAELQPDAALGQIELGQQLTDLKRPAEALKAFTRAADIAPDNIVAWRTLIVYQARSTGLATALATVAQATAHAGIAPYGDALKGDAYWAAGQPADAENAFRIAFKRTPDDWVLLRLADIQAQTAGLRAKIATLAAGLKTRQNDETVRSAYAAALMDNKETDAAIAAFQTVLAGNPANISALNNLAWMLSASEPAKALALANRAFGITPESPLVQDTLAWVLLQQGKVAPATILLHMAHAERPEDPEIAYHLGVALMRAGDVGQARAVVEPLTHDNVVFADHDDARQLWHKLAASN